MNFTSVFMPVAGVSTVWNVGDRSSGERYGVRSADFFCLLLYMVMVHSGTFLCTVLTSKDLIVTLHTTKTMQSKTNLHFAN